MTLTGNGNTKIIALYLRAFFSRTTLTRTFQELCASFDILPYPSPYFHRRPTNKTDLRHPSSASTAQRTGRQAKRKQGKRPEDTSRQQQTASKPNHFLLTSRLDFIHLVSCRYHNLRQQDHRQHKTVDQQHATRRSIRSRLGRSIGGTH